jgi:hypothetical protein
VSRSPETWRLPEGASRWTGLESKLGTNSRPIKVDLALSEARSILHGDNGDGVDKRAHTFFVARIQAGLAKRKSWLEICRPALYAPSKRTILPWTTSFSGIAWSSLTGHSISTSTRVPRTNACFVVNNIPELLMFTVLPWPVLPTMFRRVFPNLSSSITR